MVTKEDRDIHAANNMICFYLIYDKLDRLGTNHTSIKGPVKISYNKFISKFAEQEDTTSLALCLFTKERIQELKDYFCKLIQEDENPFYICCVDKDGGYNVTEEQLFSLD